MTRARILGQATRSTLAHPVGHACADCAELRSHGPGGYGNPWAQMMGSPAFAKLASDAEAESRRYEMAQATRKAKSRMAIAERRKLAKAA